MLTEVRSWSAVPKPVLPEWTGSQCSASSAKIRSSPSLAGQRREGGAAVRPLGADAVADLGADLRPPDEEVPEVVRRIVAVAVRDGGRVEQRHQVGEGALVAVVRGGAGQDQGVGARSQCLGEGAALAALVDEVVGLVDDDRVPLDAFQVVAVLPDVLECVHRDDHALVVRERIAAGGDLALDALDAQRVEPHQGDREPGPQLVLELLQDALRGHDENAFAAAPADELGEGESYFKGLAEADDVRDQDAGAEVTHGQGELRRPLLVGERVEEEAVGQGEAAFGLRQRRLAQDRFEEEASAPEVGGGVGHQTGLLRVQEFDLVDAGVEDGLLVPYELGDADGFDPVAVTLVLGPARVPDQPFLVPDKNLGPGRKPRLPLL